MRERKSGRVTAKASDTKKSQSELPALLLPQPRPARIEDPDCGRAPVIEPENRTQTPEEARGKRTPDNAVSHPGGQSA